MILQTLPVGQSHHNLIIIKYFIYLLHVSIFSDIGLLRQLGYPLAQPAALTAAPGDTGLLQGRQLGYPLAQPAAGTTGLQGRQLGYMLGQPAAVLSAAAAAASTPGKAKSSMNLGFLAGRSALILNIKQTELRMTKKVRQIGRGALTF